MFLDPYQYAINWPYATGSILSWLDDLELRRQWHALSARVLEVGGTGMLLLVRVDLIEIILFYFFVLD